MKFQKIRKAWLTVVSLTVLTGSTLMVATGCSNDYRSAPSEYRSVYYNPYDYYYYPSLNVYFHISSGYYYYRDGGTWIRVRTLPPRIYLDPVDRVRLIIKSDKPYLYHEHHRLRYTPHPTYRRDIKRNQLERKSNTDRYNQYKKNQRGRH